MSTTAISTAAKKSNTDGKFDQMIHRTIDI